MNKYILLVESVVIAALFSLLCVACSLLPVVPLPTPTVPAFELPEMPELDSPETPGPEAPPSTRESSHKKQLALALAHVARLRELITQDQEAAREAERAYIRHMLLWICGISFLLAAGAGIAAVVPLLAMFSGSFINIAIGFVVIGVAAYSGTYALEYARYIAIAFGTFALIAISITLLNMKGVIGAFKSLGLAFDKAQTGGTEVLAECKKELHSNIIKYGVETATAKLRGKPVKKVQQ